VHGQLFESATAGAAGVRKPAIIYVHGGPPRQMLLGWHYMDYYANDYAANQYLASRGFIVLSVNYRLGIGYGHAFQYPEAGGVRGASEYLDVLAGGRYLQSRGDVDGRRIGIWGGSYGGYLTALALGRNSDVFAAGVDIHGVHDFTADGGRRFGDTDWRYEQTDRDSAAAVAWRSSPVSSIATWKSPVLLIHGDDDRNVPFTESITLAYELRKRGVPVEELVFPDEVHDFLLFRNWVSAYRAAGEFLERKLGRPKATATIQ
jgi:dipeptidyl aminopeptidase/acylaminoacyl peptidase